MNEAARIMADEFHQVVNIPISRNLEESVTALQHSESTADFVKSAELSSNADNSDDYSSEILKSGLLGVNLQPEKILEVFSLPVNIVFSSFKYLCLKKIAFFFFFFLF